MNEFKLSVIIPCYNDQEYLSSCLDSIESQNYVHEVIVVDDGSHTPVSLPPNNYSFEIKLIRKQNQGLSEARNTGINEASGTHFLFLDVDDELNEGCVAHHMKIHSATNNGVISYSGYNLVDKINSQTRTITPAFHSPLQALLMINIGPPHIFVYPRNIARKIGYFYNGPETSGGHEDYDYLMRAAGLGIPFLHNNHISVKYFKRSSRMSSVSDKMAKTRALVWDKNVRKIKNVILNYESLIPALIDGYTKLLANPKSKKYISSESHAFVSLLIEEKKVPHDAVAALVENMKHFTETAVIELRQLIEFNYPFYNSPIFLHPQDIISWKIPSGALNLKNKWLSDFLSSGILRKYNNIYIYGYGALSSQLYQILKDINFPVAVCSTSREYKNVNGECIDVPSITDLNITNQDIVVIGSISFYEEMRSKLLEKNIKNIANPVCFNEFRKEN